MACWMTVDEYNVPGEYQKYFSLVALYKFRGTTGLFKKKIYCVLNIKDGYVVSI